MIPNRVLAFYSVLLTCVILGSYAANHYCMNGIPTLIKIDEFYNRDETIVPSISDERDVIQLSYKNCRWSIENAAKRSDLQLVLQAVPMDPSVDGAFSPKSDQKPPADLVINYSRGKILVTAGLFFVYPLGQLLPLTVEAGWDPRTQSASQIKLRLLLALPGICDKDMLSFNGNCYAVNDIRANLTAAMSSLRGDAQLASFSSMAEIDNLTAANAARLSVHPYRRPLSLSQPVRLGMFYRAADAAVLSAVRNDSGGCGLRPVLRSEDFKVPDGVAGRCASLRVDASDRAAIAFDNCSSSVLVLVKFPEIASLGPVFETCNIQAIIHAHFEQPDVRSVTVKSTEPTTETTSATTTQWQELWNSSENAGSGNISNNWPIIVGVTCAIVAFLLLLAGILVFILKRKTCGRASEESGTVAELKKLNPMGADFLANAAVPEGSVPASAAVPGGSVPASAAVPGGSVPANAAVPGGSVPASAAVPEGSVPASAAVPEGSVPASAAVPEKMAPNLVSRSTSYHEDQTDVVPEIFNPDQLSSIPEDPTGTLTGSEGFDAAAMNSMDTAEFQSVAPNRFEPPRLGADPMDSLDTAEFQSIAPNRFAPPRLGADPMDSLDTAEFQSFAPHRSDISDESREFGADPMDSMASENFQSIMPSSQ